MPRQFVSLAHILFFSFLVGPPLVSAESPPVTDPPYVPSQSVPSGGSDWFFGLENAAPAPPRAHTDAEIRWIVFEDTMAKAESQRNPSERIYTLESARRTLERYLHETPPKLRDSRLAERSKVLQERTTRTLQEIRVAKENERPVVIASPELPSNSIPELLTRVKRTELPLPFTLNDLTQLVQRPIFVKGPHVANFDLRYIEDFGHYNPEALEWAKQNLLPRTMKFSLATSQIFRDQLAFETQQLLRARYYLLAHRGKLNDLLRGYQKAVGAKHSYVPIDEIKPIETQGGGIDAQELAYWLRREVDGTAASVQELLELLLDAYAPYMLHELERNFHNVSIIMSAPGTFHEDEMPLRNGEAVFTLQYGSGNGGVLENGRLRITNVNDPVMDQPNQKSGKEVSLDRDLGDQVLFLRGEFKAGPLKQVQLSPLDDCINSVCRADTGGSVTTITSSAQEIPRTYPEEEPRKRYTLEINDGGRIRIVEKVGRILWSGDLNRDGHLDIIYEDTGENEYNLTTTFLLLSTPNSKYRPMRDAAQILPSAGC